ncbi:MAG: energy-coupling factor transporter transmembrane protein EcfT [Coriobacteriia bacterium]|nr:energy-coupling factor transporter transmembrane protein EcfT [Coriobacteriia bacterium]
MNTPNTNKLKPNEPKPFSPQGMLLAAVVLVVGIVVGMPHAPLEIITIFALVLIIGLVANVNLPKLFLRSLIVIPIAGCMAAFAPLRLVTEWSSSGIAAAYAQGAGRVVELILTPWMCVLVMLLLVQLCPEKDLLYALERLHVPRAFTLLLTFMYRYVGVMRTQLTAAHRSLVSRAPSISPRKQVLLYGNLAGAMLIRAHSRGERIHAAMLSRGFTGLLPRSTHQRFGLPDAALVAVAVLLGIAFVLL